MTADRRPVGRFVLAPVVGGEVAWAAGVPLLVAPIRLAAPVRVVLGQRAAGGRS
ncbi:hypothetical protein [Blastococcus xanthinilyticus]|uniref:Uncharacterized protein n=1 Tax=Blastococcus xanthinilyticus TaxID=1564164 RepID=A0A5S5CLH8_9ACTN|nr:hypothetical protein [Blastococcus xanthinilyticus]TYP82038.1 hypothetical protein BD833_12022 [Blastococcus xanthinilyticus]